MGAATSPTVVKNVHTGLFADETVTSSTQDIPGSNINPAKLTAMLRIKFGAGVYDIYVSFAPSLLSMTQYQGDRRRKINHLNR